jgi:sn-glycerol 3-phosphate transport system permease protein
MVPAQVTILPNYLTVARLGWINTFQGIIIPGASVAYGTFLLRQYYRILPSEIMDAARVDGAGHVRTLWSDGGAAFQAGDCLLCVAEHRR